jgi:hypothetical protein
VTPPEAAAEAEGRGRTAKKIGRKAGQKLLGILEKVARIELQIFLGTAFLIFCWVRKV